MVQVLCGICFVAIRTNSGEIYTGGGEIESGIGRKPINNDYSLRRVEVDAFYTAMFVRNNDSVFGTDTGDVYFYGSCIRKQEGHGLLANVGSAVRSFCMIEKRIGVVNASNEIYIVENCVVTRIDTSEIVLFGYDFVISQLERNMLIGHKEMKQKQWLLYDRVRSSHNFYDVNFLLKI